MTISANTITSRSIGQVADAIHYTGAKQTILVQGHMGTGKTSLLGILAKRNPHHIPVYFDSTTKDLGDLMIPMFDQAEKTGVVRYAFNEELGLHHDKPVILMIDEFGKANPSVKNGLLRLMLERQIASKALHPDSLVFATTNLGGEGVGDMLRAHERNRITLLNMRKPTNEEWIGWGTNNSVDPILLAWAKENPQAFNSYEQHKHAADNPYIFHPQSTETSFVTPRSLAALSQPMSVREHIDSDTLYSIMCGTVGTRAGSDLNAYVELAAELPKLLDIQERPETASIPENPAALCMVVFKLLTTMSEDTVDAYLTYFERTPKEAQGLFANGVRHADYEHRALIMNRKAFGQWALKNNHMFSADKA